MNLLKEEGKFVWNEAQDKAFTELRNFISSKITNYNYFITIHLLQYFITILISNPISPRPSS